MDTFSQMSSSDDEPGRSIPPQGLSIHASRFVAVVQNSLRGMDQMLGYSGQDRYVALFYEPRGEEVMWRDSRSYGFATGAWITFMDDVAPVADLYKVDVGSNGTPAKHVLLYDRAKHRAYFAEKGDALKFLARAVQGELEATEPVPTPTCVEITHQAIMNLAHELWESKGRPQGQDLQVWLEAESRLKRGR